jgi:hypothetical protein
MESFIFAFLLHFLLPFPSSAMSSSQHPMPHSQRHASGAYARSQYSNASSAPQEAGAIVAAHGGQSIAGTSAPNEQGTLLQSEVLDQAKKDLDLMLCTFMTNYTNIKDEKLWVVLRFNWLSHIDCCIRTKETRSYRDAVAENLTSLLGLLNELTFANAEAAKAIRQILAHDITNPIHTERVDVHIDKAIQALGKASKELVDLEKKFVQVRVIFFEVVKGSSAES